jgi:hypothetical protein
MHCCGHLCRNYLRCVRDTLHNDLVPVRIGPVDLFPRTLKSTRRCKCIFHKLHKRSFVVCVHITLDRKRTRFRDPHDFAHVTHTPEYRHVLS